MIEKTRALIIILATLVAVFANSSPGFTQEKGEEYQLESVKVVAQKREENVQKIPMSIAVLGGMPLQESRITELNDIGKITPNLHINTAGGSGTMSFVGIRGRMSNGTDISPTVAILVDGVPYDDFYALGNNLLYDVERVEVLRGPQSAMYGLNSVAGVINIITKQPAETLSATVYGEGGYGDKWDGTYLVGGSVSGPLVEDKLSAGVAAMFREQGGYVYNQFTGERYNTGRNTGLKGNINWTPSKAWDIAAGLVYSKNDSEYGSISVPYNEAAAMSLPDGQQFGKWKVNHDWDGGTDVETWAPHLKINYAFDALELTSTSAYRSSSQEFDYDMDLTSIPALFGIITGDFKSFTQELRIQSKADEQADFEWLGGYFYHYFDRQQLFGTGSPMNPSVITPNIDAEMDGSSHAVFGQATYRVLDGKLGFTAGFRQEWTHQEAEDKLAYFDEASVSDSQFLPKVAVDYQFTLDHLMYASITQGWRSGGINFLTSVPNRYEFKKETCWSYEVGTKTKWLDNRLQFNAAAFYVDYTDYQDQVSDGPLLVYLSNAPKVRMVGFEADLEAVLSPSLFLSVGFGYTDARYEDFPDAASGDFDGNRVMNTPDFDAILALKYTFMDHFYIRPEIQGVGTIYWDRANTTKQDPYALFNLRAGYTRDNYEIYVFGDNLTNKYAFRYAYDFFSNGNYYGDPVTPFQAGLGLNIRF